MDTAILSSIAAFGFSKAVTNDFAGRLADAVERKKVLVSDGGDADRPGRSEEAGAGHRVE